MRTRAELALRLLDSAGRMLAANIRGITIDEALQAAGGYRSTLGLLKHTAGWSHVYHSYAFDAEPKHWAQTAWPRGIRDTIEPSQDYLDEIITWFEASRGLWRASLQDLPDDAFDEPHRYHQGWSGPLFDIVVVVANHWTYHTGELNAVLAIIRGEAWELTEEVEENHISTAGHRLRPGWMNEEQVARHEAYLAMRDAELHPPT
jgi:hypothetical protein